MKTVRDDFAHILHAIYDLASIVHASYDFGCTFAAESNAKASCTASILLSRISAKFVVLHSSNLLSHSGLLLSLALDRTAKSSGTLALPFVTFEHCTGEVDCCRDVGWLPT